MTTTKLLLAIEDIAYGRALAQFVIDHNWPAGTVVRVLHVHGWAPPERELLRSKTLMEYLEDEYAHARKLMSEVAQLIRDSSPNLSVEEEIMEGNPTGRIIATATAWGADMIVLGSHGRTGLSQFLMGSVSLAVTSNAPCSVVVIRIPAVKGT